MDADVEADIEVSEGVDRLHVEQLELVLLAAAEHVMRPARAYGT